jgi:hypothetical protein
VFLFLDSEESIVPQRLMETSWATETLNLGDSLDRRLESQQQQTADTACFPQPIRIEFHPQRNVKYSSRFRFTCELGNSFDLMLQGEGTNEEQEHKPLQPMPK